MPLPFLGAGMLATVLTYVAGAMVIRALLAVGIGIAVFVGVDLLLDNIQAEIFINIADAGGLFPTVLNVIGMLQFDIYLNMIFSAYTIKTAFSAPAGILKRFFLG